MNYYFHYRIAQRIRIARKSRLLMSSLELSPITPRKVDRGKSLSISVASSQKSKTCLLSDAELLSRNEDMETPNRSNDLSDSESSVHAKSSIESLNNSLPIQGTCSSDDKFFVISISSSASRV